ncbi:MAG: nucleotidyltransferase [Chitinophagaceae bacterium]|nr:nucleotidyltransferase [Chitinophagaceae bacterium]
MRSSLFLKNSGLHGMLQKNQVPPKVRTEVANKIINICRVLNNHTVQYMVVGGTAVAYHGYFRWSVDGKGLAAEKFDLDFWYNPTYKNYFNLLNALQEMGQDAERFKKEQSPDPKNSFFRFELENFTIDYLPKLKGLNSFRKSFDNCDIVTLDGVEISFLSLDDLIADKSAQSRPQDLEDIKELKKRNSK